LRFEESAKRIFGQKFVSQNNLNLWPKISGRKLGGSLLRASKFLGAQPGLSRTRTFFIRWIKNYHVRFVYSIDYYESGYSQKIFVEISLNQKVWKLENFGSFRKIRNFNYSREVYLVWADSFLNTHFLIILTLNIYYQNSRLLQ